MATGNQPKAQQPQQPPPQQPPQPPPPPPGGHPIVDAAAASALIAALAALLASNPIPTPRIIGLLHRSGVSPRAAESVTNMVTSMPPRRTLPIGDATRSMRRTNHLRRAAYLLNAARRVSHAIGRDTRPAALVTALERERRYWRAHVEASQRRMKAAEAADAAAVSHGVTVGGQPERATSGGTSRGTPSRTAPPVGPRGGTPGTHTVLGWWAHRDGRTTAECGHAHGKNWYIDKPPGIGIPGTVHPRCRCRAVAPWNTNKLVDGGTLPDNWRHT